MTSPLWTLGALADAAGGTLIAADPATPVTGLSIDTRTLQPGEVFFAFPGVRMDGHTFVPDAKRAGAAAVVVAQDDPGPAIRVADGLQALRDAGIAARARTAADIIAVTGSVGKTGTKEMLRLALAPSGSVHASTASFNNHWGVPLSLARMPADTSAGVFEIGMNHAGEITPLTHMVRPHVAIVTAVAAVHLEFFPNVAAIADAKAEIFLGLEPGGTAIIPAHNRYANRLRVAAKAVKAKIITFGGDGDVRLRDVSDDGTLTVEVAGTLISYRLAAGPEVAMNSLAVLAAIHALGRPLQEAADALDSWRAPRGRGREVALTIGNGSGLLIDEAYNANPASVRAAIGTLAKRVANRRIAIIGDMLELGPTADALHRELAETLIEADIRIVHTVGTMTEMLRDALPEDRRGLHAPDAQTMIEKLPDLAPGDAVLVKGSNAIGLSAVVDAIEQRFATQEAPRV